jgi:hypothetical protein
LALGELARAIVLSGGSLLYGGHLDPEGYTAFLQRELEKYGRRDRPLRVCLAWSEHRKVPLSDLKAAEDDLGLLGEIIYLDRDGVEIEKNRDRDEAPRPVDDPDEVAESLTSLRRVIVSETQTRIFIGGRRSGFMGRLPGVLEEAEIAIRADQPIFLAGGFGGITSDVASIFGLDPEGWLQPAPDAPDPDSETRECLAGLPNAAAESGWTPRRNGLESSENARLAVTHRPGEVASLVVLGLSRLHTQGSSGRA